MPASKHMDRLTAVDAAFLAQEREGAHMHVGAVLTFDGPAPPHDEVRDHIESRLHLVPRYRQKLAFPRLEMGRPLWVDDPRFNIDYHLRRSALPPPGSMDQLRQLAARVFSQRLDRSKPLWEIWMVEGLDDGRFALVNKTHHCLVDGVSGVDLTTVLFDVEKTPTETPPPESRWLPAPEPTDVDVVAEGLKDAVAAPLEVAGRALRAARDPGHALDQLQERAEGVGEILWGAVAGAPETPLNVPNGPHRRLAWVRMPLGDLKGIKDELGGTVNDVFLTIVSGALRRWLISRGVPTEGLELRGAVPVSIRAKDEQGQLGNRITIMVGRLPVYAEDPLERLEIVRESMAHLKESKQAVGAQSIARAQDFAPPTIFAQASRLNFSPRLYNLLVTNVPGPQFPLYLLGKELREFIPIAFLAQDQALAVAIISYNGNVVIGLMGDYDAMPDLDSFADDVEAATDELKQAAGLVPGKKPARAKRSKTRAGAAPGGGRAKAAGAKRRSASERAKARSAASRSKGAISSVTRTHAAEVDGDGADGKADGD
jgi:diacylglycerol O-acyltransferase / wax synthase